MYDILNGVSHKFVNQAKRQAMHGYWFPLLFVALVSLGVCYLEIGSSGGQTTISNQGQAFGFDVKFG